MDKNKLFELDDKTFEAIVECQVKEKDFRKKSTVKKKSRSNHRLYEQLMEKDLKEKGYIK